MSFARDFTRPLVSIAGALLLVGISLGGLFGSCHVRAERAEVDRLRADSVRYAEDAAHDRRVRATLERAVVRNEQRAADAMRQRDSVTQVAARIRAAVAVDGTTVVSRPDVQGKVDTLATDPRVAAALTAADARHVADSLAIGALLVQVDTLTQALASADSLTRSLDRQLAASAALRVAVERVNRRPRFGLATGLVLGIAGTAAAIHLAGSLSH